MSPYLVISVSGFPLTLAGYVHVRDMLALGVDVMDPGNDDGMWRYMVEVQGTGIEEYYEFEERHTPTEVGEMWLEDAEEKWSGSIAEELATGLKVTPLWDKKTQTYSEDSEAIVTPLPEEAEE